MCIINKANKLKKGSSICNQKLLCGKNESIEPKNSRLTSLEGNLNYNKEIMK